MKQSMREDYEEKKREVKRSVRRDKRSFLENSAERRRRQQGDTTQGLYTRLGKHSE